MLPQPVPITGDAPGAPLSRSDQVRLAARARNTQRAYLGHWTRFHSWAQEQGLDLPGGLEAALCDYLVRLAEDGKRMATIRQARAAIIKGADLAGWPKPGGPGVAEMMRGLGRILRGPQRQAAPLHAEALAAIRATAFTRRRTRGGHTETAEYAQRRGLVDVALASAQRWGDVELAGDGSGRIRITESKTDQEAEGVVLYLGPAAVEALLAIRPEEAVIDAVTPVFNLHPDTIRRRLQQAARAAGLPGWRDITGHSGRVGMAQDLSAAGFALPELMTAGRWKSPRMPARYTERQAAGRGAVARYYQGGGGRGPAWRSGTAAPGNGRQRGGRRFRQQYSAAVHGHPRELGKAATRLCRDVVCRPPGWCYALCTPLFLAGRSPLQRGDENYGKVDPDVAQDQGHEEQGRVRHQGRRSHPERLHRQGRSGRRPAGHAPGGHIPAVSPGQPPWLENPRLGNRAEASRR